MIRMFAWCGMNRSMFGRLKAGLPDRLERRRRERPRREPVGLLAFHPNVVLAAGHGLGRWRALRAAGRQPDHVGTLRLGRELDAEASTRLFRSRQDDGAGPVAEEDARRPIRVVEEAREELRADHKDVLREAARDPRLGVRERVDEARAGGHDVHRRGFRVADGLLHEGRGRWHPVVGGERREQDEVDVIGLEAGRPDRPEACDRGHRERWSRGPLRRGARGSPSG